MTQIEVPDNVQDALASLLEVQFKLGMHAARRAGQTAFECKPAADALVAVCDSIKAALQDERDRCARVCESAWEIDGSQTAAEFAARVRGA